LTLAAAAITLFESDTGDNLQCSIQTAVDITGPAFAETAILLQLDGKTELHYFGDEELGIDYTDVIRHHDPEDLFTHLQKLLENGETIFTNIKNGKYGATAYREQWKKAREERVRRRLQKEEEEKKKKETVAENVTDPETETVTEADIVKDSEVEIVTEADIVADS
jgi:deoxyxylulose-5-phosphate synthase